MICISNSHGKGLKWPWLQISGVWVCPLTHGLPGKKGQQWKSPKTGEKQEKCWRRSQAGEIVKNKESPSQNRRVGRYATYMISYNTLPWFTFTQFTCNAYNCPLHSHSGTAVNITVSTTANKPCTKLQTSLYPPTAPHFHHHRQYSHAPRALSSSKIN